MDPDYGHLQRVVLAWRALRGMSQSDVAAAGGPSDTTLGNIEAGKWSSRAPADTLKKLDRGFGWPKGTARRVLYESFDPVESWPTGRPVGAEAPLEFGPGGEWLSVLEDRLAHRREQVDILERQRADVDYQIRALQIEIDYLLRERAELMHVAGPKGPDLVYTDEDGRKHVVEIKRVGDTGGIGEFEFQPLDHVPAPTEPDAPTSAGRTHAPPLRRAARNGPNVGRARRRAQDEDAEASQDDGGR